MTVCSIAWRVTVDNLGMLYGIIGDFNNAIRVFEFGRGFYTTKFRLQAESWAQRIGTKHGNLGFVTEFEFKETFFAPSRKYNVLRFDGYTNEWLDFGATSVVA